MKFNLRALLVFIHDLAACALAWFVAYWLRFNLTLPFDPPFNERAAISLVYLLPLYGALFLGFGLYRGFWRFASLPDLKRIAIAVGIGALAAPVLMFMLEIRSPRSVFVMHPIFLVFLMGGSRLAYRAWREQRLRGFIPGEREPVFVIGTEEAAATLIRDLERSAQWTVLGVFDPEGTRSGRQIQGVNVLGGLADMGEYAKRWTVYTAIIAMPDATHSERRRVMSACDNAQLRVLTVPSFDDLMSGRITVSQVRHVELDDLLGRDPVKLDTAGLTAWLKDNVVLVTGAGGSIGGELCRQIAGYRPRCLVLFELNEFALYNMEQEFSRRFPDVPIVCAVGDVKDARRIGQVMSEFRPDVVFHAAAYKHVPLMEDENAWQAVLNNVRGTFVVAKAAAQAQIAKFVLISTDKAVNPTNVMGASKRLAEMVCQSLQQQTGTRYVMVRFGNVLGSTGSVIPKFREQIAHGGPITVTHPEITRYFMSIPEAVQLVLQAGLMGQGGEIFVLDMGEPVRIADLARDLIRLSGLTEADIRIEFTGLRPGEKLYEEPLAAEENSLPTPHPKLRIARARTTPDHWLTDLAAWLDRPDLPASRQVKAELSAWVPDYRRQDINGTQSAAHS